MRVPPGSLASIISATSLMLIAREMPATPLEAKGSLLSIAATLGLALS